MKHVVRFRLAAGALALLVIAAVWVFPSRPPAGVSPEVARWVRQLRAEPGLHQRVASGVAGWIHPGAPRWLPGFLQAERVSRRNLEAAHQLLILGRDARPAVPQLAEAFEDRRGSISFYAFMAVTYSGVPEAEFVGLLRSRHADTAGDVRFFASLLATEDERVRDFAWGCLEASGMEAVAAESRLRDLAAEGDPALRERARRLLDRLGLPRASPASTGEIQAAGRLGE